MNLSVDQIGALLQAVSRTRDRELTCDECLVELGSFAEHEQFKPHASIIQSSVITSDWDGDTIADPSKPGLW